MGGINFNINYTVDNTLLYNALNVRNSLCDLYYFGLI